VGLRDAETQSDEREKGRNRRRRDIEEYGRTRIGGVVQSAEVDFVAA